MNPLATLCPANPSATFILLNVWKQSQSSSFFCLHFSSHLVNAKLFKSIYVVVIYL